MAAFKNGWAILAATVLATSPAFADVQSVEVRTSPIHAVPADNDAAPARIVLDAPAVELAAPQASARVGADRPAEDGTLNAQYAALKVSAPKIEEAAPAGPAVPLARTVVESAGAFENYMRRATAINPKFTDGAAVAAALTEGSTYQAGQLEQGAIAYAALVALQDPMFVQSVHDLGFDAGDRSDFLRALGDNPRAVMQVPGADGAAAMVSAVLGRMGYQALQSGKAIKQAAYDVQHQAWSKEAVPNPEARLAKAKAQSAARFSPTPADTAQLVKTVLSLRKGGSADTGSSAPTAAVVNGIAIAALAVLNEAGDDNAARLEPLLNDARSAECVKMAKLNLFQCLAVAGPQYEDVFCLGQHAVMETAQCVVAASGQVEAPSVRLASAVLPPKPTSMQFPVALDSSSGPERGAAFGERVNRNRAPAPRTEAEATYDRAPAPARLQERLQDRADVPEADDADIYAEEDRAPAPRTDRYNRQEDYAAAEDLRPVPAPRQQARRAAPQYDPYAGDRYAPPAYYQPDPRDVRRPGRAYMYDRAVPDYDFER